MNRSHRVAEVACRPVTADGTERFEFLRMMRCYGSICWHLVILRQFIVIL